MQRVYAILVASALLAAAAARAEAQTSFGAGPLTSSLVTTEPTSGVIDLAHMKIAPGLTVQELGHDDNVFDQHEDPKEDFVIRATPDVSIFTRTRFMQFSGHVGVPLAYYHTYEQECSVGQDYRGRVDLLASRLQPFVGAARSEERTRPSAEVDVRAQLEKGEVSGGIGYATGPHSLIYLAYYDYHEFYSDAEQDGVDLAQSLNHYSKYFSGGLRTALTPLANLTFSGGVMQDRFKYSPERNGDHDIVNVALDIRPEAALSGNVSVGYQYFKPDDPLIEPFKGMTAQAGVTYPFLEIGRVTARVLRGFEYSYDVTEAYYRETTGIVTYTHHLFNAFDLRGEGSRAWLHYGYRQGVAARTDRIESVTGSVGYNLRNRTRLAINYEYARRLSPAYPDREYNRRRLFFSWSFAN